MGDQWIFDHVTVYLMYLIVLNVLMYSIITHLSSIFITENGNSKETTEASMNHSPDTALTKFNSDLNCNINVKVRSNAVDSFVFEPVMEIVPSSVARDQIAKTGSTENHSISTNVAWHVHLDTEHSNATKSLTMIPHYNFV